MYAFDSRIAPQLNKVYASDRRAVIGAFSVGSWMWSVKLRDVRSAVPEIKVDQFLGTLRKKKHSGIVPLHACD